MTYRVTIVRSVETSYLVTAHSGKDAVAAAVGKRPARRAFRQVVRAAFRAHGTKAQTLVPVYVDRGAL
jgi:glutaminase